MSYASPGMRFEESGQERRPRRGEWYRGIRGPAMAERDFDVRSVPILRRVDDGPRSAEEIERERLDADEKVRSGMGGGKAESRADHARSDTTIRSSAFPAHEATARHPSDPAPPAPPRVPEARPNDLRPIGEAAPIIAREYRLPYTDSDQEES